MIIMSQEKSGHITGINKGKIVMYGLSTCVWCKKTRQLLTDLGVDFDYVYVDLLSGNEEEIAIKEVKRFNPSVSFPTVIINDERAILGFDEQAIRKAFSS
jgi:glutaredoxin-like protein NrdH